MHLRLWRPFRVLGAGLMALLALLLFTAAGKRGEYSVTFHTESSKDEAPKFAFPDVVGSPPRQVYFGKVPDITHNEFKAFYPFPSDDGSSYGVAFKLSQKGQNALQIIGQSRQGQYLRTLINGRPVDYVLVDRPSTDEFIVVWRGFSKEMLDMLEKKLPKLQSTRPDSNILPPALPR